MTVNSEDVNSTQYASDLPCNPKDDSKRGLLCFEHTITCTYNKNLPVPDDVEGTYCINMTSPFGIITGTLKGVSNKDLFVFYVDPNEPVAKHGVRKGDKFCLVG